MFLPSFSTACLDLVSGNDGLQRIGLIRFGIYLRGFLLIEYPYLPENQGKMPVAAVCSTEEVASLYA